MIWTTRVPARERAADPATARIASDILAEVRTDGIASLRRHAERLDGLQGPLVLDREVLRDAFLALPADQRALLERTADRIARFAEAHRAALADGESAIPGGAAGWRWAPVERAGCYAPGGRFPLPSSVLMTAVTARVAGVPEIWVASPRPAPATLAAAWVAGARALVAAGGAQAIGAFAYGAGEIPACDVIVGPGNRYVTAAKALVAGQVAIDMPAGPSELLVIADATADPERVAADLLAQAEHDEDALPILVATDRELAERAELALARQVEALGSAVAAAAVDRGWILVAPDLEAAARVSDAIAPEHVALHVADPGAVRLAHYGARFDGSWAAEVLGDYGAGPNHVLPTSGAARSFGALSVATFLRVQTWLRIDDPQAARGLAEDAAALGRLEGLEAHARSAERRLTPEGRDPARGGSAPAA